MLKEKRRKNKTIYLLSHPTQISSGTSHIRNCILICHVFEDLSQIRNEGNFTIQNECLSIFCKYFTN